MAMLQVVGHVLQESYKRLKPTEIYKPSSPKSGRGRLQEVVVNQYFQQQEFDLADSFGILDMWSHMTGGGRLLQVLEIRL